MKPPDRAGFLAWLEAQGAQVQAVTNPYEFARFLAQGQVNVLYTNKRGDLSKPQGFAAKCLEAYAKKANLAMGFAAPRKNVSQALRASLLSRDGDECFFCALPMAPEEMTVEHLVARGKGGPNHMDNLVLAHARCNHSVGSLPLIAKVRLYHRARTKALPVATWKNAEGDVLARFPILNPETPIPNQDQGVEKCT